MLKEYILIPMLFYYASNDSIFDCNINLFLTLCLYIYIYIYYIGLTACYWTKCGGSSFNKTLDYMCSSECEEDYYSFPSQEL